MASAYEEQIRFVFCSRWTSYKGYPMEICSPALEDMNIDFFAVSKSLQFNCTAPFVRTLHHITIVANTPLRVMSNPLLEGVACNRHRWMTAQPVRQFHSQGWP